VGGSSLPTTEPLVYAFDGRPLRGVEDWESGLKNHSCSILEGLQHTYVGQPTIPGLARF